MLCLQCGNEIYDETRPCPVCEVKAERGSLVEEIAEVERCDTCQEPVDACTCTRELQFVFCPNCGNQVLAGSECPICTEARTRQTRARHDAERHMCPSCGNEVYGKEPCAICTAGRAHKKKKDTMTMCRGCGNMVEDANDCPICESRPQRVEHDGPACHGCQIPLVEQDWDGADVLMCEECNGCFFLDDALEVTLDKLRADSDDPELKTLLDEFKERRQMAMPGKVRYKPCPICGMSMSRRNYMGVSGVIVDNCTHGIWVEQAAFGELSEFVSLGGDKLAKMKSRRRR